MGVSEVTWLVLILYTPLNDHLNCNLSLILHYKINVHVKFYAFALMRFSITCRLQNLNLSSSDECTFCYCQSNIQWLLPASYYCQACSNQIVEHSAYNEAVLGNNRKQGGAPEHLIDGSEKHKCWLTFEF